MRSIAITNQKGGSGKTTCAWALAATLRARGNVVSLLDTDPQRALALLDSSTECVEVGGLRLALRRSAGSDYTIVDTPPSLGEETRAAAELCDAVLVPTRATYLDLRSLGNLLARLDPSKVVGMIIIAWRGGYVAHERRVAQAIEGLGFPILARIPLSVTLADAALLGKPITEYGRAKRIAREYEKLAEAIETWRTTS